MHRQKTKHKATPEEKKGNDNSNKRKKVGNGEESLPEGSVAVNHTSALADAKTVERRMIGRLGKNKKIDRLLEGIGLLAHSLLENCKAYRQYKW